MLNLTPFLKLYAKYRTNQLNNLDPVLTQEKQLLSLVKKAQETKFGVDHKFNNISSVKDFQQQVPLRKYEDFWNDYWKGAYPVWNNLTWPGVIPFFPLSSGTSSGTTKYIPCTHEMIKSNTKAGLDMLVYHLNNRPQSQIFSGKNFFLGGSTDLRTETTLSTGETIYSGDLSGITAKTMPWWAKMRYFPPQDLALISDWEEKINLFAEKSAKEPITSLGGVPAWMLIFIKKLIEKNGNKSLGEIYPKLELVIHGGVNFSPYIDQFREVLSETKAELREVYPASEGFIASADRGYGEGLRINLDNQIFYEFVPLEELDSPNPTRHWIKDIELDINYAIVLTTCAGLWSYVIGDTVRFIDRKTPRLLVTGRTSYYLSAFGEHLIAEEIEDSINYSAKENDLTIEEYSVGAIYPKTADELGGHLYVIEFKQDEELVKNKLSDFIEKLDTKLCQKNEDYAGHRAGGFGLNKPKVLIAKSGTFNNWMKSRGKFGGQNKVPRIITNVELFESLVWNAEK